MPERSGGFPNSSTLQQAALMKHTGAFRQLYKVKYVNVVFTACPQMARKHQLMQESSKTELTGSETFIFTA